MVDQESCLLALVQTLQHEDIVLLVGDDEPVCPVKQIRSPNVVLFNNWADLHKKLHGFSADPEPTNTTGPSDNPVSEPTNTPNASTSQPKTQLPEEEVWAQAAVRIQLMWRRYWVRRNRANTSDYSQEGFCYENLKTAFSEIKLGTTKKENLLRKVLMGPNLSVIIALEALSEQLQEILEDVSRDLRAPGIDAKAIEALQSRQKKIQYVFMLVFLQKIHDCIK